MTDTTSPAEWYDISVALGSVEHLASLARSADQLRWAAYGALQNLHREAVPPGVIEHYETEGGNFRHLDVSTPAGQERSNREGHHREIIWLSLTSIINAAGNISKLLWGGTHAPVRKVLRQMLDQPDEQGASVIGKRQLRNHFEHQDDRLLKFLAAQRSYLKENPDAGRIYMQRVIFPERHRKREDGEDSILAGSSFGWWAPDVDKLWFLNDELDLGQLVSEVINIGETASRKRVLAPGESIPDI